jgi:hypothetical protein
MQTCVRTAEGLGFFQSQDQGSRLVLDLVSQVHSGGNLEQLT